VADPLRSLETTVGGERLVDVPVDGDSSVATTDGLGVSITVEEVRGDAIRRRRTPRLSRRQREVVSCLALGLTIDGVAKHVGIARGTAVQHRTLAARALGLKTVVELTHYAIVEGWVQAGDALSTERTEAALLKIARDVADSDSELP
jgi:DNA-binding CsgD family transcriptional regulator